MKGSLLAALVLTATAFAMVPTAEAIPEPCVAGSDPSACAVSAQVIVCVTEPCDTGHVCVAWGLYCRAI